MKVTIREETLIRLQEMGTTEMTSDSGVEKDDHLRERPRGHEEEEGLRKKSHHTKKKKKGDTEEEEEEENDTNKKEKKKKK